VFRNQITVGTNLNDAGRGGRGRKKDKEPNGREGVRNSGVKNNRKGKDCTENRTASKRKEKREKHVGVSEPGPPFWTNRREKQGSALKEERFGVEQQSSGEK